MERHSFCIVSCDSPKLCGNFVFPQYFNTRKLVEITVFFAVFFNEGKLTVFCLKLITIMLQTWILVRKYRHKCTDTKNILYKEPQTPRFCWRQPFLKRILWELYLKVFSSVFRFFFWIKGRFWQKIKNYGPCIRNTNSRCSRLAINWQDDDAIIIC